MCDHEKKCCPRCHGEFECKVGSITQCQCTEVILTPAQRAYMEQSYNDCLCKECLLQVQEEMVAASR